MEYLFNKLGKHLYASNSHNGYFIEWKNISPLCKKWSRNRDPDINRVNEMIEYHINGGYIPKIIHLAELEGEGLICYDGNHRRNVFDKINENIECIVDIIFNASQTDVYNSFNNINKSVQLPAIYLDDNMNSSSVKLEILDIVKYYEDKYKQFISTSSRCRAPHFNRDNFVDNIYDIYTSLNCLVNIKCITKAFEILNIYYSKEELCRPHSCYNKNIIDKCKKYNMWLFIDKTIPVEHIKKILDKTKDKL